MNLLIPLCCFLLTIGYVGLMILYRIGWGLQPDFKIQVDFEPSTRITVIIPARNEAQNIAACIRSITAQEYPSQLLEIILVDDHSEDQTISQAQAAAPDKLQVVSLKEWLGWREANAYKKEALSAGIANSNGELIVTTDADCVSGTGWLRSIAALFEKTRAAMIIGPVNLESSGSELGLFQSLDFMMMQGITVATHRLNLGGMANGANLAFSRSAFNAVDGYEGTRHLASGDDYLLLHKMRQAFPEQIQMLKSKAAIVQTAAQPDWISFLRQRIRWASKSGRYSDHRLTIILAWVYLFNLSLLVLAGLCFWKHELWRYLIICWLLKMASELLLLLPVANFFGKKRALFAFPVLQPLHVLYIIVAGLLGLKGSYKWKGRKVH
ncbi:MAG: glycosyltransferase [Bacteroidetes bacterium]|nr:glycosyltransferase [Bacteroidota bacterium]